MHLAFVLAGLGAGGAERVVSLITRDCCERGHDVTLFAFDSPGDPVYHAFDPRVRLVRLALPPARGGLLVLRRALALRRALLAARPALVLSFLTKINITTLLATTGTGLPVIVSERNNPLAQQASRYWNRAAALLYPRAAAIVIQTGASRRALPADVRSRAIVIPNPVPPVARAPRPITPPVLAAVGRLEHQKGFDLLLRAFAAIAGDCPEWQLVIWGEGPLRAALTAQIHSLGLADRARLAGLSTAPGAWLGAATAFVLSSRYEGFPNALAEAMAAGLPVAAFACDFGPADLIDDGADGLLVAGGDVAALAGAMRRLATDPALRSRLGASAQSSMRRFESDIVLAAWRNLVARSAADRAVKG